MLDNIQSNSTGWLFYVKTSFALAIVAMTVGIVFSPIDLMVKGYLTMSALFLVSSTITLSKTMRDEHESEKLLNKINEAKTQQLIKEYAE
ncbi:YiaA/YiaB family inner membrane protein [Bacterioplanoides sp.]|uniref:YiaA/YiaB family inner membrane protein n=1 Tax=Bacterioplanoides sp. TaxID=2066072 RepID=UPI003B006C6A